MERMPCSRGCLDRRAHPLSRLPSAGLLGAYVPWQGHQIRPQRRQGKEPPARMIQTFHSHRLHLLPRVHVLAGFLLLPLKVPQGF